MGQLEQVEAKKRWFDDLSITQLVAGALAAATSLLLSTQIGIAGSVIGVAVGSIVSAVAGNVYKYFLQASAEKIKEVAPLPAKHTAKTNVTHVNTYTDATIVRERARRMRQQRVRRRLIIVTVVSALVTVGVTALLITMFTAGKGLGEKAPIIPSVTYAQSAVVSDEGFSDESQEKDVAENTQGETKDEVDAETSNDAASGNDSGSSESTESGATGGANGSEKPSGSTSDGVTGSGSSESTGGDKNNVSEGSGSIGSSGL